ncbi:uncharacterized protein LOC129591306 isoform X2 [Paramacrobiotus metropolitanus]|uniref:uncharacterized protein LOC129591306 isoform X2 n=1 Tax=Paramacrobiotus metropolitanus TaxID=2943436 RepID=UPI002445CC20|nr:uncharacterized protein LOC129591306 isoform X2 [Paramacrobiotus metropolitanus]
MISGGNSVYYLVTGCFVAAFVAGTVVRDEDCRRICSPKACSKLKCPLIPTALCVNDVCGCSAFFIQRHGKNLIDVTDFCGQRMPESWQLPSTGSLDASTGQAQASSQPAINQAPLANTIPSGCRFVCLNEWDVQDSNRVSADAAGLS